MPNTNKAPAAEIPSKPIRASDVRAARGRPPKARPAAPTPAASASRMRPTGADSPEQLALLEAMREAYLVAKARGEPREPYKPSGPDEVRILNYLNGDGRKLVSKRGKDWRITLSGLRFVESENGQLTQTQIRCMTDDVLRARIFASQIDHNLGVSDTPTELADVVRLWSEMVDFETFATLRGLGAEAGFEPATAAVEALKAIVEALSPDTSDYKRRERIKREVFG